jgi:hypothetical protein
VLKFTGVPLSRLEKKPGLTNNNAVVLDGFGGIATIEIVVNIVF